MKKLIDGLKALNQMTKFLILAGLLAVLVAAVLVVVFSGSGKVTISVESSLKEIVASSQMRTAEYTYNSIAEVKDGKTTKYYVSYKGTVVASFDFDKVEIERDGNVIRIIIPDEMLLEVKVDSKFDYIFTNKKYDTEKTYAEAKAAAEKDLEKKANESDTLLEFARESAKDTIKALVKPFESQLAAGETIEVIFASEKEAGEQ